MPIPRLTPIIGGRSLPAGGRDADVVLDPWTGTPIAEAVRATAGDLDEAIATAAAAFPAMRAMPRHARRDLLARVSTRLAERRTELGAEISRSCGKPITQSLAEVDRATLTFSLAADETRRFGGEVIPLDVDARAEQMLGSVRRFPVGPISAISPFNFPLNLLAHKVAPAIAVGSTVVVKPPPQCPQLAFLLGQILAECGLPAGAYSVLHLPIPVAEGLATDPRLALLSFTGSATVGWHLRSIAGKKKVVLELGGNAACVVHEDAGPLEAIARRVAVSAFAYAGQVCIKTQRLFVHEPIYERFTDLVTRAAAALPVGDPSDPATVVGPLIDARSADRVERWVAEAVAGGARTRLAGARTANVLSPGILEGARATDKVSCMEVFGPVLTVAPYARWSDALAAANDSPFGLQAGVFTRDIGRIFEAYDALEVGGVMANEVPNLRVDNFPYGGVKESGFGREGVRYAMEDMSEPRMLVLDLRR